MKSLLILLFLLPLFTLGQTIVSPDSKNWKHTGNNEFTKQLIIQAKTLSGSKIDGWDAAKAKVDESVDATQYFPSKADSNYTKPGSWTSRFDFKYEATNQELWKMWKAGGATVSKLMPIFPLVNVGGTALTNGRMYVYRYYTPDTITLTGFNLILSAQGNYTGDGAKFNGIKVGRYSNDSIYIIGGTTNDTEFWKGAAGTVVQKPLSTPIVLYPGFWAIMPLYNYITTQTAAPAIDATYVSAIAKAITFTGGWRISSYINSVGIPAASYKYSSSVSGETVAPHIILVY